MERDKEKGDRDWGKEKAATNNWSNKSKGANKIDGTIWHQWAEISVAAGSKSRQSPKIEYCKRKKRIGWREYLEAEDNNGVSGLVTGIVK